MNENKQKQVKIDKKTISFEEREAQLRKEIEEEFANKHYNLRKEIEEELREKIKREVLDTTKSVRGNPTAEEKRSAQARELKRQAEDRKLVKGLFKYYEIPGGKFSFIFKEHKDDPIKTYEFEDGKVYEIPLGVARHLNKNVWYPKHMHSIDENGNPHVRIGQKIRRVGFESLEFQPIEEFEIEKDIVTVEKINP